MGHLFGTIYGLNILPLASTFVFSELTGVSVETFLNQFRQTQQPQERSNVCYMFEVIQLHFTFLLITWILYEN